MHYYTVKVYQSLLSFLPIVYNIYIFFKKTFQIKNQPKKEKVCKEFT